MPALLLLWFICIGGSIAMMLDMADQKEIKAFELECKEKGGIVLVSKKDGDDYIGCYTGLEIVK